MAWKTIDMSCYKMLCWYKMNLRRLDKKWRSLQTVKPSSWRMPRSHRRLKPSINRSHWRKTPNESKLGKVIDRDDGIPLLKTQAERPRKTPPISEPSTEVAPSLMPETLGDLALTRKVSKCPETPQECRSGYENHVGEVSDSDSRCSLLDLRFTES